MARGTIAKTQVTNKIAQAFGEDYIGEYDKKLFVWANDGGEKVQIAIALTCPKTFIDTPSGTAPSTGWDFSDDGSYSSTPPSTKVDVTITEEEKKNIEEMMARLGL